jgi:hypothetical protein
MNEKAVKQKETLDKIVQYQQKFVETENMNLDKIDTIVRTVCQVEEGKLNREDMTPILENETDIKITNAEDRSNENYHIVEED